MRPGVTVAQVQQEVNAIAARIPHEHNDTPVTFRVDPYQEVLTGPVKPVLYALLGALGLVLLIACANVSNLLIARALGRQQEFAVRAALGAGKTRLIVQMLSEGLLLSLLGCGVGVALAELAMVAIRKLPDGTIPRADSIAIHWTVLLVLAGIAAVTTVLSSLLPALLVARANPQVALQAASRGVGLEVDRRKTERMAGSRRGGAVDAAAGGYGAAFPHVVEPGAVATWDLRQRTLQRLRRCRRMRRDSREWRFQKTRGMRRSSVAMTTYEPVLERIRQVPGVESAALATSPPLSGMNLGSSFDILGQPNG